MMWVADSVRPPQLLQKDSFPVAQSVEFYTERADEAAKEALNATLANVRERALRSEASWRAMATRARMVETTRARRADEAAARAAIANEA